MTTLPNLVNFTYEKVPSFHLNFTPISREIKSWKEELCLTAKTIADSTSRPLYLCLSGGIDSEVAALAFLSIKAKFKVFTLRYVNNANLFDVNHSIRFCETHKLEQIILDIDPLTTPVKYIQQGYQCTNLFRYLQLFILDTISSYGGCAILGGGEQIYYAVDNTISIKYDASFILALDWCANTGSIHYPYFHMQNSELLASYMTDELLRLVLSQPDYFLSHHYMSIEKILMYHRHWPLMPRRRKSNGFENLILARKNLELDLIKKFGPSTYQYFSVSSVKNQLGI